jgi:3D (Asp-Asp-Asp) domain-containing protein
MEYNQETINLLKEAIDEYSDAYAYSGRGMYGATCLGFNIADNSKILSVIIEIVARFVEISKTNDIVENVYHLVNIFEDYGQDDMGKGTVIYFPTIEWIWDK